MAPKKTSVPGRPSTKRKDAAKDPETADEFLALGVDLEESAEKWRVGDSAKSSRFYKRALDNYDVALARFPQSFDLAYNKARVQYQITQHPRLLENFAASQEDLLEAVLASHRRALALDSTNPDVLFNTGQVLTSLAEAYEDQSGRGQPVPLLQEAIRLFQQCLARQEVLFGETMEFTKQIESMSDDDSGGGVPLTESEVGEQDDVPEEQWASVVEPVTKATLLDTIGALLESLAAICGLLSHGNNSELDDIQRLGGTVLEQHLTPILEDEVDDALRQEASLMSAKFKAAILEAQYKLHAISVQAYDQLLKETFENAPFKVSTPSVAFLTAYAEGIIAFCAAIPGDSDTAVTRWTRLTKALDCLTEAAKAAPSGEAPAIHVGRGDVELLRFSLSSSKTSLPENLRTVQVRSTLVRNAETYYRGAAALAEASMNSDLADVLLAAKVKRAVAGCLASDSNGPMLELLQTDIAKERVQNIISDMVDEYMIPEDFLQGI